MDLLQQRLTFACMWAFEDIGVQELEKELCQAIPQANCRCEYSRIEEVLVIKGKLEGLMAPIATTVSSFIEKQKNKDLLNTPRLRLLALPSVVRDHSSSMEVYDAAVRGCLLTLDDDAEQLIPHPMTQVTKFWLSSAGGVGCFASNKYCETLEAIAKGTGTEITVLDDLKGIQISGRRANDVDDALAKLTQIEKPLSYLRCPAIASLDVRPMEPDTRYRIQPSAVLNPVALRRILADPSASINAGLGQMFVTASYTFDEEAQKYTLQKNLLDPPRYGNEPAKSRLWNEFTFQEVGNGDEFRAMEQITNNKDSESRLVSVGVTRSHPFLSSEKAKQVNQWVAGESSMSSSDAAEEVKLELTRSPPLRAASPEKMLASPDVKKAPGIKVRRPVKSAQISTTQGTKVSPPQPQPPETQVAPDDKTTTLRRRWKMKYEPDFQKPDPIPIFGSKSTLRPSGNFDPTMYGPKKNSDQTAKPPASLSLGEKAIRNKPLLKSKPPPKKNVLIDVSTPADTVNLNPNLSLEFDIPALIPGAPTSGNGERNTAFGSSRRPSPAHHDSHFAELAGLNFGGNADQGGSASSDAFQDRASGKENFPGQEARLRNLAKAYQSQMGAVGPKFVQPRQRPRDINKMLEERVVGDYERAHRSEMEQPVNEMQSRQYHRTMNQKTANPGSRTNSRAELKAKKQATLEDAWGAPKPNKQSWADPNGRKILSGENPRVPPASNIEQEKKLQKEARIHEDLKRFFAAVLPTLEAAESFPGILTFEIQFGLIFVPLLPKSYNDGLMSPSDWSRIFQPRAGIAAPTTKFVNRVTVFGSDVDHIIDLKTSKAEGKSRIFEQEYNEYNISYEFHCRTKADELLIVVLDEQGNHTIMRPNSMLGAVNLHFPGQIWDARAIIGSSTEYTPGTNSEFEEAVKYLIDHVWIPAEKHIHIFTILPEGNEINIEKVFMKRWTRHRCRRPGEALGRDSAKTPDDHVKQAGDNERSESQDIFLQVTEVHDLFFGMQELSDSRRVRARYTTTAEMIQKGKLWYEISLVSPALEAVLKANAKLEIGERTEDWRAADLFGGYSALLADQPPNSQPNPVAAAIGAGGFANLFRIANTVVEKIDGVGYFNPGPMAADTPRASAAGSQAKMGWDFEDLESVKEVESVAARVNPSTLDADAVRREQYERDYW
ncbi:uncharacterized protein BJX67DRAFT_391355 [Aspergillus lucknowensis]|uniref:Uncharacterized protein n=1 Tax=Aspergillus lucknowensis TaxID=176173 RepID=A0ABR4LZW4_9EURO